MSSTYATSGVQAHSQKKATTIDRKRPKVGHAGTLDPFATGVLIVAIGSSTRLLRFTHAWEKEYETTITLGAVSSTDDSTGEIIKVKGNLQIDYARIKNVLTKFEGSYLQSPPAYAAIKVAGMKLYEYARKGESVTVPLRRVHVSDISILKYEYPNIVLRITCSTGTYIRALARDIGEALQIGAYCSKLRRTRIGHLDIRQVHSLDDLTQETFPQALLSPETLVGHLPRITLSPLNVVKYRKGQTINELIIENNSNSALEHSLAAVFNMDKTLIGVGTVEHSPISLQPNIVF